MEQENDIKNGQQKNRESIPGYLLQHKQTIAVAESVTAGRLQSAISNMKDASQFFQGGITAYNIAQKYKHLQVEPIHALAVNCVSQQVANQMALQVCSLFSSDWGVAVTGYATAVPESGNKVFAYFAIAQNGKIKAKGLLHSKAEGTEEVQENFTAAILHHLLDLMENYV